jgi:hypothetical protein
MTFRAPSSPTRTDAPELYRSRRRWSSITGDITQPNAKKLNELIRGTRFSPTRQNHRDVCTRALP